MWVEKSAFNCFYIDEIERLFKIDERVLKYMTVLLDKNIELDKIKEEIAAKEAEKNQVDKAVESEVNQEATDAIEPEADEEGTNKTNSEDEES